MKRKYDNKTLEFLNAYYPSLGAKYCSEQLNLCINYVYQLCAKYKIRVGKEKRSNNSKIKKEKPLEKYKVNPNQFISEFTPISVYILGLIWADGHVSKNPKTRSISLATTYPDANTFIPLFLKTGNWSIYSYKHKNNPTWKLTCQIVTSNKYINDFLLQHGYLSKNNNSADLILSKIPEKLHHYWFRGLFDGDGHLHTDKKGTHNLHISSTYDQNWNYIENMCKKLNIRYKILKRINKKTQKSSSFYIFGMYRIIDFCNYIYNNYPEDNIGLKRKYDRFLELLKTEEKNRYTGVSFNKKHKNWRAYTSGANNCIIKHLGCFLSKEEALNVVKNYYDINPKNYIN